MIKIRYRDPNQLSPGLHAAAERHGRKTVVYLMSGLTAAERRSALRRLRLSARMGHAPRLPAAQLALALLADRIRTTLVHAGAVFRSHPAGSTVPVMVVSAGAIAFLVLSTVSIRVVPAPPGSGRLPLLEAAPPAPATASPVSGSAPGQAAGGGPGEGGQAGSGGNQATPGGSRPGSDPGPGAAGAAGTGAGGGPAAGGGTTALGQGGSQPAPAPGATAASTAPATAAAASTPAASPSTASPAPTATKSGVCLHVGALGICLDP
jgi:hypothetical protein